MTMSEAITVRRIQFPWAQPLQAWWNPARPEFSQIVNSASLAMPFLEPYLIATMKKARPEITDAALGYRCIPALEARLKADYQRFAERRSFRFNLAYAEGFEAMALTIGHMLVEERRALFAGADPAVSSLVLWHFVEEIEHKTVTYDVLAALGGNYLWRIWGLLPRLLRVLRPGYDPREVPDPEWATRWRQLHDSGETGLGQLDTRQLDALSPQVMAA